jgi:hypothetical protein
MAPRRSLSRFREGAQYFSARIHDRERSRIRARRAPFSLPAYGLYKVNDHVIVAGAAGRERLLSPFVSASWGRTRGMTDMPRDRGPQQGPKGDYRFDYVTFGLLAIGVIWAVVEIALRYV